VKVVVSRAAIADVARLRDFLIGNNERAARRAVVLIDDAMKLLADFPHRGRPSGIPGVRELIVPFGKSAYVLRYAHYPDRDEIVILRVWHGREERL